jgi:hypothetical protein
MAPALLLMVVAPLVAEFLLGDVSLASLGALVVFIPLYGAGALLIREVVRRGGGGWPAIAVFAGAFGVAEEGLATQSLFNPDYAHQHLLGSGYVPALGIAVPWTVHVLTLHVIWSICTPIALVECMVPDRRTTPWLRTRGLVVVVALYGLGIAATVAATRATYPYVAPTSRLAGAALVALVLVLVGARLTTRRPVPRPAPQRSRPAPAPWVVGTAAAVATSILVVASRVPTAAGSTLTFLLTEAVAVAAIAVWSRRSGWGQLHVLALAAAALFAYAWHAFTATPAFDSAPIGVVRVSNVVFAAMALAAVLFAARRLVRSS